MVLQLCRCVLVMLSLMLGGACLFAAELSPTDIEQLRTARPGAAFQLPVATNRHSLPHLAVRVLPEAGAQFLFSDKPEYFPTNGIALQETVQPGVIRLYVYHVPEPAPGGKVISAVIGNPGTNALRVRMLRRAFPKPGMDYQRVAKDALIAFLTGHPEGEIRSVVPGGKLVLDPAMDTFTATKDQLVHGFYEFEVNAPAQVSVFQRDPGQASLAALDSLAPLSARRPGHTGAAGAGRGMFLSADFKVVPEHPGGLIDTAGGPAQLVIADGKRDPWMRGHDGIEDRDAVNAGNYGALYRIKFKRASSDGRKLAILFSKLDVVNQWCGAVAAAMMIKRGDGSPELVLLPSDKVSLRERGEVGVIAVLPPLAPGKTEDMELVYSPPGAACLPTPLLFLPFD